MKLKNKIVLGIDTSCYTTSIAAINLHRNLIFSKKELLKVKEGCKGLRQSEGVFQHTNHLGDLFEQIRNELKNYEIVAISVSSKPRPVEDSYMPVFYCGSQFGKAMASVLKVPFYETTHQEGHIEAAYFDTKMNQKDFITVHISGGTTEILLVHRHINEYKLEIIGGTKDISVGQLIDRVGVKLGYPFPCGMYLDKNAMKCNEEIGKLSIFVKDGYINFSGIETKIYGLIEKHTKEYISKLTLTAVKEALFKALVYLCDEYKIKEVLFVGGVSSSEYISYHLEEVLKKKEIHSYWTKPEYAKDNAIGTSLIGVNCFLGGM